MRFVVAGAGAVGGVVGARLFEHGHDVTLVARGAHCAAIREKGLRIDWPGGSATLPVPVTDDPSRLALGPGDVVLLAVKGQDSVALLDALPRPLPPGTSIVCLQNGVENERAALRRFPDVYAVTVMCPAGHLDPGVVIAYSAPVTGILDIGRYPDGVDATAEAIAAAWRGATFSSEARPDIMRWKWRKLLTNLANAAEAAFGGAGARDAWRLALAEGERCLAAAGIDVATADEDRERRDGLLQPQAVGGVPRPGGSSWQSLARATGSIETDYLNGEIVLLGRLHGIPTPANAALQDLALRMAARREAPESGRPDSLLAAVRAGEDLDRG